MILVLLSRLPYQGTEVMIILLSTEEAQAVSCQTKSCIVHLEAVCHPHGSALWKMCVKTGYAELVCLECHFKESLLLYPFSNFS